MIEQSINILFAHSILGYNISIQLKALNISADAQNDKIALS